ncbi:hypothetical protein GDO78_014542, partial [Eleutherodactylus coqui]
CSAIEVKQDEKFLIVKSGNTVKMRCNQDQSDYLNMIWYQQKAEQGLQLMVLSISANSTDMEGNYKTRWSIQRPTVHNSTLTLTASSRNDSAVYFCAASKHSLRE